MPLLDNLLAGATDEQQHAFRKNLPFHVGLAILTCATGEGSSIDRILLMISSLFPSFDYGPDSLLSLLHGTPCPWIDQVARELLDYDSYFEICDNPSPNTRSLGYLRQLPHDAFRVRPGQEYRFMSLPPDDPSTPFRFKALPSELRKIVLGYVLACPNTVLGIDVMENRTRQGRPRPYPPKIIVADVGRKAGGG